MEDGVRGIDTWHLVETLPTHSVQELVVDVLKEELGRAAGMAAEEVNDWVIRKTVGGPLRWDAPPPCLMPW